MISERDRPRYKLKFPSSMSNRSEYLQFTEAGALLVEAERKADCSNERLTWIKPADTQTFLDSIGEQNRRPEFEYGEPTHETKAMLRRLIKQFGSTEDLLRCWRIIRIKPQRIFWPDSSD